MSKVYDVVLFDIDNTLTELQPTLDIMGDSFGRTPVSEEDIHSFTLSDAYGVTMDEELTFWQEREAYLAKHSKLAQERVKEMFARYTHTNTEIHIVTMRPPEVCAITRQWLDEVGVEYDYVMCLGQDCKLEYAREQGIEAIFEDNPRVFDDASRIHWADQFDLYIVDYPYNRRIDNAIRLDRRTGMEIGEGVVSHD